MAAFNQSTPTLSRRILALARQMDWFRGLRAAFALCVPLVIGDIAGLGIAGWAALGGFEAILADTGGPYRNRLASLATLSFGGGFGLFLGSIAGRNVVWAIPVTLAFCFFWSYLSVLGQPFSTAGLLVQVIYICGVGTPSTSWHIALTWAVALVVGGAWAAVLSLFLWPLDAYRPARIAVADCYTELASFLASVYDLASRDPDSARQATPALWHRLAQHHQFRIRRALERAWDTIAQIRAEHRPESNRTHQLVVLAEHADILVARTIALAEHFESQASAGNGAVCFQRGLSTLTDLRSAESWIASLLLKTRGLTVAHARARWREMDRLPQYLAGCVDTRDADDRFLLAQVTEAASVLESSIDSASLLRLGRSPVVTATAAAEPGDHIHERLEESRQRPGVDLLTANFTFTSLSLRHALRVSLVCGLDVAIILLLNINHGYWLLLTSIIVLQPHVSGTLRRGLERIGGTIGGGILAALLAVALHSQLVIAAVLFPLALLSIAIMPVSYAAFAFFLTPAFVLAWLPYSGDWQLALVRVLNTFAGAIISILAMLFLFPIYERERAPAFLLASIAADRRYLEQLISFWNGGSASTRELAQARRRTGLAHNDTDESLERLLAEAWPRRLPFAHFATASVTYLRRLAQTITTLASLSGETKWKSSDPVRIRFQLVHQRLLWLENQIESSSPSEGSVWPQPAILVRDPAIVGESHPGERLLERIERQTEVLHRQLQSLLASGWLSPSNR